MGKTWSFSGGLALVGKALIHNKTGGRDIDGV